MNSSQCWDSMLMDVQKEFCKQFSDSQSHIQDTLEKPMPYIGAYIAAASSACLCAMAYDLRDMSHFPMFWFPCKYFPLNATSLTLLAVVMKLTLDLTSPKYGTLDALANSSSLTFMSIAMCNFMTSVGSMDDDALLSNLVALGLLVITISVNMSVSIALSIQLFPDRNLFWIEQIVATVFLLVLFNIFCVWGFVVPTIKRDLEFKSREMHTLINNERVEDKRFTLLELKTVLRKYWVMSATGSIQFVMARSAVCVIPGLLCLLMDLIYIATMFRIISMTLLIVSSSYKSRSLFYIMLFQTIGILIGTIAPLWRWYIASKIRTSVLGRRSLRDDFKMETYWNLLLVECRESRTTPALVDHFGLGKVYHVSKQFFFPVCIKIQTLTVQASKLLLILTAWCQVAVLMFLDGIMKLFLFRSSSDGTELQSTEGTNLDLSRYVLLLEGELEFPPYMVAYFCKKFDRLMTKSPESPSRAKLLVHLLKQSGNFNGLREFDSSEVTSLHHEVLPNCWFLPLATLACIVQAVPRLGSWNIRSPLPGLRCTVLAVKLVDKSLHTNPQLLVISKAADIVWDELEQHHKWQGKIVSDTRGCTYKDTLREFSDMAKEKIDEFKSNPRYAATSSDWPAEIFAANSMYRICETLLLRESLSDAEMYNQLIIMMADILFACLTNLPRAIMLECDRTIVEKKEYSVVNAASSLIDYREALEYVEQREWPSLLDHNEACNIDTWRAVLSQEVENPVTTVPATDNGSVPESSNDQVSIEIV